MWLAALHNRCASKLMNTVIDSSAFPPSHTEVKQLRREVARLTEENADLRASALVWQRLYAAAVERTRDLEQAANDASTAWIS